MRVLVVVPIRNADDLAIASRPIAGRPWLARLVARIGAARSAHAVAVVCHAILEPALRPIVPAPALLIASDSDPFDVAAALDGPHDLVAFCPVEQLFADPQALDDLAAVPMPAGTARAYAALSCDPSIALSGGAWLQVLTRDGLRAAVSGADMDQLPVVTWPASPEPPELRIDGARESDLTWAVTAFEALLAADPSARVADMDGFLTRHRLGRFGFWDGIAMAPRSILTVRCFRPALFDRFVRHLSRVPGAAVDVICPAALADDTARHPAVRHVVPFDAPAFDPAALSDAAWSAIRDRAYDLCVVPRRTSSPRGFENLLCLPDRAAATVAVWLDLFGRAGLLAGRAQAWEWRSWGAPPADRLDEMRARATRALAHFTRGTGPESRLGAVLDRMDEQLRCRALVDNPELSIDLSSPLLHQTPAAVAINRRLAACEAAGASWVPDLQAAVDGLFAHLVDEVAASPPGATGLAAPATVLAAVDELHAVIAAWPETGPEDATAIDGLIARVRAQIETRTRVPTVTTRDGHAVAMAGGEGA